VLLTEFTIGDVAATPLTVLVRVLTALPKVWVVAADIAGVKFKLPEAIPFIVDVNELPLRESALVLIIGTPVPAMPLIVVVSVLVELLLLTEFTIGDVAATPLTVLVRVLTALPNVWVVAADIAGVKFKLPEAIPFIVDVNELPERESALVLIIGIPVPAIPFIVVVSVFTELVLPTEFTMDVVAATPLTVLVRVLAALPNVWLVVPITNGVHTGEAEVPVFTMNTFVVVLNINKPVAGKIMAFCWAVVIRGARNPLLVLLTSSIALVSAKLPFALIETFCANKFGENTKHKSRSRVIATFFIYKI
jgi:hypothetical protein